MIIRTILISASPIIRLGMRRVIAQTNKQLITHEACSVQEALHFIAASSIVWIELNWQQVHDFINLRCWFAHYSDIRLIVFLNNLDCIYTNALLHSGIHGLLTMQSSIQEMLYAFHNVCCGRNFLSLSYTDLVYEKKSPFLKLSQKELQIVLMILHGWKIKDIALKIFLSAKTVMGIRFRILKRLGIKNNFELIRLAWHYKMIGPFS